MYSKIIRDIFVTEFRPTRDTFSKVENRQKLTLSVHQKNTYKTTLQNCSLALITVMNIYSQVKSFSLPGDVTQMCIKMPSKKY